MKIMTNEELGIRNYPFSFLILNLSLLIALLCSGCGPFGIIPLAGLAAGAGGGGDETPPAPTFTVVSIDPIDGASNVDIYSAVTAIFSEAVDPGSVTNVTFSVGGVSGSYYFYDNYTKVRFVASPSLPMITDITVNINSIESSDNPGKFVAPFTSSFVTGGASTASPYVVEVVPPDSFLVPFQTYLPVRVLFSKPMSTVAGPTGVNNGTFYIYHTGTGSSLNGSVSWDVDFREFTFTPTDALLTDEDYEVRVEGTVNDTAGYSLGSLYSSSFSTVDLNPTAVIIPANPPVNPAGWINTTTQNDVTVRVGLNGNVLASDHVWVTISDGVNPPVYDEMPAGVGGPANIEFTGLNASALNDGAITLEAGVLRGEFGSEITTGNADKDTVDPSISLSVPSPIPQYYELRMLEMRISVDSDGDLHLTGGRNNQSVSVTSGTYTMDYELRVAGKNDIDIYSTDDAGNQSNHFSQTVYQRGGASGGPVSGTLQVSVYRESTLEPVGGVMVVCGYSTEVKYTDYLEGVATFEGVFGPQAVTVICAGYPIFTILDVDAARLCLPLIDIMDGGGAQFATVRGNVNPVPTNAMFHHTHEVDWESEDKDITDGDFAVRVRPNRHYTISAIDNSGGAFSNFIHKPNLGPLKEDQEVAGEDLNFPGVAPPATRLASGDVTLPEGFYLPAALLWERGRCLVMSQARAESDRFLCGYGTFPFTPIGGGPFNYSSIQPGYYDTPSGEYWMVLIMQDIYGRAVSCSKPFPPGGPFPDFDVPAITTLDKPGTAGVVTTLTPKFGWTDSNFSGLHMLQIANMDNGNSWLVVARGGIFNATLPSLPPTAPVKVMEFRNPLARLQWRVESIHFSSPLDFNDFCNKEMEFGQEYSVASEWRDFNLWDPASSNGRVPEFGAAGKPAGSLTVTVVDMETQAPVPGATVFLGDDGTDPTSREVTDAWGQAVFSVSGPQKLTVCHTGYPYVTFDQVDCAYATIPLMTSFDGEKFTLYGEVFNLPDSNAWATCGQQRGEWFQIHNIPPLTDDYGNVAYMDGSNPENYSLIADDRDNFMVVSGFYGFTTGDNMFDYAFFSDIFQVNPVGVPLYQKAPTIDYTATSSVAISPMRRSTDPSDLYLPSNLVGSAWVDGVNAKPEGIIINNADRERVTVKIGTGEANVDGFDPTLYHYGITFASPHNFQLDSLELKLDADGGDPDGTEWESQICLRGLIAYPRRYDTTLPDIPYPVSPLHGDSGVGLPINMTWENTFQGKKGLYMIMFAREMTNPFYWMILVPIPDAVATAGILVPTLPAGFNGPEVGLAQGFQIEGTVIPGFNISSWSGDVFEVYDREKARYEEAYFTP